MSAILKEKKNGSWKISWSGAYYLVFGRRGHALRDRSFIAQGMLAVTEPKIKGCLSIALLMHP